MSENRNKNGNTANYLCKRRTSNNCPSSHKNLTSTEELSLQILYEARNINIIFWHTCVRSVRIHIVNFKILTTFPSKDPYLAAIPNYFPHLINSNSVTFWIAMKKKIQSTKELPPLRVLSCLNVPITCITFMCYSSYGLTFRVPTMRLP